MSSSKKELDLPQALRNGKKPIIIEKFLTRGASGEIYSGKYGERTVAAKSVFVKNSKQETPFIRDMLIDCYYQVKHTILQKIYLRTQKDKSGVSLRSVELHNLVTETDFQIKAQSTYVLKLKESFQERGRLWMILELGVCDINMLKRHEYVDDCWCTPFRLIYHVLFPILVALDHLHSRCNIIHRDLKPGNIVLTATGIPKLADFGLAIHCEPGKKIKAEKKVGTKHYWAPEIWFLEEYDFKADIWSLGMCFGGMFRWDYPLDKSVLLDIAGMRSDKLEYVDELLWGMVGTSLEQTQSVEYKWFQRIVEKFVVDSSDERPSASDLLKDKDIAKEIALWDDRSSAEWQERHQLLISKLAECDIHLTNTTPVSQQRNMCSYLGDVFKLRL